MNTLPNLPIGFIAMFPGEHIPEGWRICNGASISQKELPDTFDALAKALGQAEGVEELQLPNLMDRFVVGAGIDAELRASGEADQHTHQNDPPPQRRYTSYGDQFMDASSTQYFYQDSVESRAIELMDEDISLDDPPEAEHVDADHLAPISLEHHNHYVELDIDPFESESSEGLNRPKYYALNFVIKVA